MEHNFLTEETKNYLNTYFKDKINNNFIKEQQNKMEKASSFFFCLPSVKKSNTNLAFAKMHEFDTETTKMDKSNTDRISNLHYPETGNIEYSEYSDEKFFKNDLFAKDYKDGILLVSNIAPNRNMQVAFVVAEAKVKNVLCGKTVLTTYMTREVFRNYGQVNWKDKKFDEQVILYFVFPKYSKNKTFKIVLKNNKNMNSLVSYFRENETVENLEKTTLFLRGKAETLDFLECLRDKDKYNDLYKHKHNKNIFLKNSYDCALLRMHNIIACFEKDYKEKYKEIVKNLEVKELEELKQIYLKQVFPYEEYFEPYFAPQQHNDDIQIAYYKSILIKFMILQKSCNYNTLVNGTIINTEHKSETDCLLFWNKINLFELFFNLFNEHNSRLALNPEGIVNDLDKFDEKFTLETRPVPSFLLESFKEKINELKEPQKYEFKSKHILEEAMDSSTGYLMPYDGAFEILHDPLFNFIRFREYEDFISIVIADKNERCLVEVFDKNKKDFKYMLWNDLKQSQYHSEECVEDIYTKLATCIRDAKVLIERDSTMHYQGKRKPYGSNTSSIYHFYFPRVKYKRNDGKEQLRKEKDFFNESRKFSGTRRQHARKLIDGYTADKKQLLLAKQMDFYVPDGHTYVKASTWGDNMTKREIRYRNTSLNGIFYFDKREMSEAEKINRLSPPGFEEYSEKYIKKLGYEVKKRSNYDGGIDIRAVRVLDNMQVENLLVQCKHWNSPIPPGAIRDFKTACDMEKTNNIKKFMFITSSKFSPGAKELAEQFNIMLIDGNDLI